VSGNLHHETETRVRATALEKKAVGERRGRATHTIRADTVQGGPDGAIASYVADLGEKKGSRPRGIFLLV